MHKLILYYLLVVPVFAFGQELDCEKFKRGKFTISNERIEAYDYFIERNDSIQIEYIKSMGFKYQTKIKWISPCKYTLSDPKIIDNPKNIKFPKQDSTITIIEIIEVAEDYCIQKFTSNTSGSVQIMKVIKVDDKENTIQSYEIKFYKAFLKCVEAKQKFDMDIFSECHESLSEKYEEEFLKYAYEKADTSEYDDDFFYTLGAKMADDVLIYLAQESDLIYDFFKEQRTKEFKNLSDKINENDPLNNIDSLNVAIEHSPNSFLYMSRGMIYFFKNDYDNAIKDLEKSKEIDSIDIQSGILSLLGWAYENKGEYEKALKCYEQFYSNTNETTLAIYRAMLQRKMKKE